MTSTRMAVMSSTIASSSTAGVTLMGLPSSAVLRGCPGHDVAAVEDAGCKSIGPTLGGGRQGFAGDPRDDEVAGPSRKASPLRLGDCLLGAPATGQPGPAGSAAPIDEGELLGRERCGGDRLGHGADGFDVDADAKA